ncbi:MAG: lipopolysaccharide heptosyltransferase II [Variibacter sp.]|nr:lipopolysaccharide heptosyltransferase II [Variibacter sp.]
MDSETLLRRDFRRILLIKLSALGDVIHTIPVLNQLRRRYPDAEIHWLTKPAMAELIGHHPALDRVILFHDEEWRRPWRTGAKALRTLWTLVRALRGGRYDLVIDLHGQIRSAACTLLTGAPVRIGFDRPREEVRKASARKLPANAYRHAWAGAREGSWLAYTHPIRLATLDTHAVDRYLRVGLLLGFEPAPADFSFPIPEAAERRAGALLAEHGIGAAPESRFVLLAPGSAWETKRWTAEGFAAVARHVLDRGLPVVLIGSGKDRLACRAVAERAPGVADLCGRTALTELAAIVRRAAVVVTNDSGPMHLAAALGRPTVSMFGPTDPLWIGPYGQPDAVISAELSCAPCYLRQLRRCPHGHACMYGLAPEEVIARIERALAPAEARPAARRIASAGE